MKTIEITIINETGIHARPASILTKTATAFESDIKIIKDNIIADAKSIINILSLGLKKNDVITLEVDGSDEAAAIDNIEALFLSAFGDA